MLARFGAPPVRIERRFPVSLTIGLAILSLHVPAAADGHWERSNWSYKQSGCEQTEIADPVGIVFYGTAATARYVSGDVIYHSWVAYGSWWDSWHHSAGGQYIRDHGGCSPSDESNAEKGGGPNSRYHIRLFQKAGTDENDPRRFETVATPHHENFEGTCGHAVDGGYFESGDRYVWSGQKSGFDRGRQKFIKLMNSPRHDVKAKYWGNTHLVKQCNDYWVGSNGNVAWLSVGRH